MSTATAARTALPRVDYHPGLAAGAGLCVAPVAAWALTRGAPGWVMIWAIAAAEWLGLKVLTLAGLWTAAPAGRVAGYLLLWPGMNAREFLGLTQAKPRMPARREIPWAVLKLGVGLLMIYCAVLNAARWPVLGVGWVGMLGIIFTLHFGAFDLASCLWRRAGVPATPIMRAPIASTSLGEFWGDRWNLAFADLARKYLFRPLARRWGTGLAGGAVFLASGLIHESVISLPARGGWGGPTLYFVLQALGIGVEKSRAGRRLGLGNGWRGWAWVLVVAGGPITLLLNRPLIERVIVPMFGQFNGRFL